MILKDVLLLLRERFSWTNEQCADNCEISLSTWKRLLYGNISNPSMEMLRCLSKGFGVPVDLIMDERNTYMMTDEERKYILIYRDLPVFMQREVQAFIKQKRKEWYELCKKDYRFQVRKNHRQVADGWTVDEILLAENYINEKRKCQ